MTACGDVWVLQAGCLPEDAPLSAEILDPEEYLQLPPEGRYMQGADDLLRLRENHQHSFEEDLAAAAAADPLALHP